MNVGSLALSPGALALLFGVIAAITTAGFLRRRGNADASRPLWLVLGFGLLLARIAYVIGWRKRYAEQPASILNLLDHGFDPMAGVLGVIVMTLLIAWRRPLLRRPLGAGVAVGLMTSALVGLLAHQLTHRTHSVLPPLVLNDLAGRDVPIAKFRGQPTVINLWATWCGPCTHELPMLAEAQYSVPTWRFVFVNQGEPAAVVKDFMRAQPFVLKNVLIDDAQQVSNYYHANAYPTTLFLDAEGRLRSIQRGEMSRAILDEQLQRIAPSP